jgi:hypothetical protein
MLVVIYTVLVALLVLLGRLVGEDQRLVHQDKGALIADCSDPVPGPGGGGNE